MKKNKIFGRVSFVFVLFVLLTNPISANSATQPVAYNNLPINEKIAYLYGKIAQIKAILDLKEKSGVSDESTVKTKIVNNYRLSIIDTTIRSGDYIDIDWRVPNRERGSSNWVGLYERGDSNENYKKWKYLSNDVNGRVTFQIYEKGEYEVRLFLDNSYSDELTSSRIRVD